MKTIWESDGIEEPVLICYPPEKEESHACCSCSAIGERDDHTCCVCSVVGADEGAEKTYCADCEAEITDEGVERCRNCADIHARKEAASFVVAVYLVDQAYGGSEEGGWWYQVGELVRVVKVCRREEQARRYYERLGRRLRSRKFGPNEGRREISSVLSDGEYQVMLFEGTAPAYFPDRKPHYE